MFISDEWEWQSNGVIQVIWLKGRVLWLRFIYRGRMWFIQLKFLSEFLIINRCFTQFLVFHVAICTVFIMEFEWTESRSISSRFPFEACSTSTCTRFTWLIRFVYLVFHVAIAMASRRIRVVIRRKVSHRAHIVYFRCGEFSSMH